MNLAPLAIIEPSSGVGGLTPAPTKLSPAVSRIAKPTVTDTWTSTLGHAFGSKCRKHTPKSELPIARAASANGRSRSESTSERTRRRNTGKFTNATANSTFIGPVPRTATSTIARMKTGNACRISRKRSPISDDQCSQRRVLPSKYPANTPRPAPMATDSAVATSAMVTSVRGAASRREKTSMPFSSVPNRCFKPGGASR